MFGGNHAANTLAQIYTNSSDTGVKREVIQSYMISGNREQLFNLAKGEKDESLKRDAIRNLGLVGGLNELQQLYQSEPSSEIRREILQGFFLAGDSDKMVQAAQGEKDPELRLAAIRNLGSDGQERHAAGYLRKRIRSARKRRSIERLLHQWERESAGGPGKG